MDRKLIIALYYHPEAYPPTLNAIEELSTIFDSIDLLYRPHLKGNWEYPVNIYLKSSGSIISSRQQEQSPLLKKISFFISFTFRLLKNGIIKKPSMFLLYDSLPLFSYYLIKPFFWFDHKVWYHNHDIIEIAQVRKYSISWFSAKVEKKILPKLHIFSLPTKKRLPYFDMKSFKGLFFYLPNYPSLKFYSNFYQEVKRKDETRIIFQGRIGEGHGLEKIIETIAKYKNYKLKLVLKGHCDEDYKKNLLQIAERYSVAHSLEFHAFTEYKVVPQLAATCHIGIAIFEKKDVMNNTLDTSSNKIYEYAALGLPVLYLNSSSVSEILSNYQWAFGVEMSEVSMYDAIKKIMSNYDVYSKNAHASFIEELNFQHHFKDIKHYLVNTLYK